MKIPALRSLIRRRLLVNYRVDPAVLRKLLPAPLTPKLANGVAIAGICLIRLEQVRPALFGALPFGLASENAAHRMAVQWREGELQREGVYIVRRDTSSRVNQAVGGRLFPGEHSLARFEVRDDGQRVALSLRSEDGEVAVTVRGQEARNLPRGSVFASLAEASRFFELGSLGYSVTRDPTRLDGLTLTARGWRVRPFAIAEARSSFFEDAASFPPGSAELDCTLLMRDVDSDWRAAPDLAVRDATGQVGADQSR